MATFCAYFTAAVITMITVDIISLSSSNYVDDANAKRILSIA